MEPDGPLSSPPEEPHAETEEQLEQLWGGKAPTFEERLHLMQQMVDGRQRLDHILSCYPADPAASPDRAAIGAAKRAQSRRCYDDGVFQEAVDVLQEGTEGADHFQEVLLRAFGGPGTAAETDGDGASNKWSQELKIPLSVASKSDLAEKQPELPCLSLEGAEDASLQDVYLHLEDVPGQTKREVAWTSTTEVLTQVRMAIQRLDRILPTPEAQAQAVQALRMALLCLKENEDWVRRGLAHLFRGAVGVEVVPTKGRRHVRLRFGLRHWRPTRFGLGLFAESYFRVTLLSPQEEGEEEAAEVGGGRPALATLLCGCSHAFSLSAAAGEGEFVDAEEGEEEEEGAQGRKQDSVLDLGVSQVSMRLRLRDGEDRGDGESVVSGEGLDGAVSGGESVGGGSEPRPFTMDDDNRLFFPRQNHSNTPKTPRRRPSAALGGADSLYSRPLVAQVYGWGDNQCGCLGFATQGLHAEPRLLPVVSSLPVMERVVRLALSSRHALLLTSLGSLYTCGDGTDGALGTGDLLSSHRFRMVDFFARMTPPPLLTAVSAASDVLGSHSAALDSEGRLYTWGFGQATGHSLAKPLPEPRDLTPTFGDGEGGEEGKEVRFDAVACGGAFTLALTTTGQVYSWGLWAHGRLGLGPIATSTDNYRRRRVHKYKLKPALVSGRLSGQRVAKIAAGTGHSLAVTEGGQLFAWGRDDFGQLGLDGRTSNGFVSVFAPEPVSAFSSSAGGGLKMGPRVVDVACGAFHSLALDERGHVWSWGAAGGACLGHGDAVAVDGRPADLPSFLRRQQANDTRLPVLAPKPRWALPRRVEALAGLKVRRLSAGSHHSGIVTEDGLLYLWGESLSTLTPVLDDQEEEEEESEEREGEGEEEEGEEREGEGRRPVDVEGVHVPCAPNAQWLPSLAGGWAENVACGGHNTVVILAGDRVGMGLGRTLLQGASRAAAQGNGEDDVSVSSVRSFLGTEGTERDGTPPADVLLLVSGRLLPAHRLILARRSATFRDLIAAEERPNEMGPLTLLLPDLRHDVCRALLQYLYTDNLFGNSSGSSLLFDLHSSLPTELLAAAQAYQLPRLAAICQSLLGLNHTTPALTLKLKRLPAGLMPADIGGGLGDTAWADVRFIASGRALLAHRFILSTASEYFCAMFRSGMREGAIRGSAPVEIAVPDSYASMARVLLFLYSGRLTSSSNADVVEDLMAADRYRLVELKRHCESMVQITAGNCLQLLRLADMYSAPRLREASLSFAVRHLSKVAAHSNYLPFAEANPALMRQLFDKIKAASPHTYNTLDEAHRGPITPSPEELKEKAEKERFDPGPFPYVPILCLIALGVVYSEVSRVVALGPLIPALNLALTAALVVYGLTVMKV